MRHVGVKKFRDNATQFFGDAEPIAIERHGRLIGFYIPVKLMKEYEDDLMETALSRLDSAVSLALEETGLTQDELADCFDLSKPIPDPKRERG